MSVDVAVGTGKIDTGSSYAYLGASDAVNNVAITTADATNPRRDIIVAYVDKSVVSSASSDNPGALKFIAVAGTPAGSPSDPSAGTIQSAVGAGNPYAQLARVSVAASASSITNAVIADLRTAVTVNANIGGSDGWNSLGYTPSTVTANGNRSYSLVFTGVDLTPTLSPGMRLKTTRTVTAPTQSTSLNGTTQYYSKTSPSGMTFTDDFTVSAWIKATSYADSGITTRYNGTSGFILRLNSSGQVQLSGFNAGSGNESKVVSYQSIPLNKWVHVAAQLDMSTFTATTTTSYVMIDGVDVPSSVARTGTNPTALIQAGNLEIGSYNAGTSPFPGKIAQVAIYSAKVTQANVLATISQGLAGTETSLISAYSFSNTITDLNANANNLTANGSAVATNADSPFSVNSFGTATGTTDYGIITSSTFSTNTTLVVQVPEANTIPTSGGVSAVNYATVKIPYGLPSQRGKWFIETIIRVLPTGQVASTGTWYNVGSPQLKIPVGEWVAGYTMTAEQTNGSTGAAQIHTTLSTGAATEALTSLSSYSEVASVTAHAFTATKQVGLSLAVATQYYQNIKTDVGAGTITLYLRGDTGESFIRAENAYL